MVHIPLLLITYANYSCSQKKSWLIIKDEEIVMSQSHLDVCNRASTSRLVLLSLISIGNNLALNDHRNSHVINSIAIKVNIRLMTLPDLLSIRNNIRSNFSPAIYIVLKPFENSLINSFFTFDSEFFTFDNVNKMFSGHRQEARFPQQGHEVPINISINLSLKINQFELAH